MFRYAYGEIEMAYIAIYSPVIGGYGVTTFYAHPENFDEDKLLEWREEYGDTYMR